MGLSLFHAKFARYGELHNPEMNSLDELRHFLGLLPTLTNDARFKTVKGKETVEEIAFEWYVTGLSNRIGFDSIRFLIEKLQKPFDSIRF
jgi:hypothetical protein